MGTVASSTRTASFSRITLWFCGAAVTASVASGVIWLQPASASRLAGSRRAQAAAAPSKQSLAVIMAIDLITKEQPCAGGKTAGVTGRKMVYSSGILIPEGV